MEILLATTYITNATRDALRARLDWRAPGAPTLPEPAMATLRSVCDRLIPQTDDRRVDLAARLDAALGHGEGDGWRFDDLPPDREAVQLGLAGIEQAAEAMYARPFSDLPAEWRDLVLATVQEGSPPGAIWRTLPAKHFFQELLGQVATLYYAEPVAQEAIGFIGLADAEGFQAIGLNRRDAIEHKAIDAPL